MLDAEEEVPSPCILVCQLHAATQICTGCLRTRDEIGRWSGAGRIYKLAVLELLEERKTKGISLFRGENAQT